MSAQKCQLKVFALNEERELKYLDFLFWSATNIAILLLPFDRLCPLIFHSSK